jgi:hypothetical protein
MDLLEKDEIIFLKVRHHELQGEPSIFGTERIVVLIMD